MSETSQKSGKKTYVGDLDVDELRAYIGLMYFRGLLGLSKHSVSRLWGKDGHIVFASTMSMERFKFLASKIAFDDKESREERWVQDRFAAIRELFERFNTNCGKLIEPPQYLALDETLYPMRNKISIKQYNPNKVIHNQYQLSDDSI